MIFDFFGSKLSEEQLQDNNDYATAYIESLNKYISEGYVPLQRLLYFYLEDESFTFNTLYEINLDTFSKTANNIVIACNDMRVENMVACDESKIKENYDYLVVSTPRFNFPLSNNYTITSFYNHQREIYGQLSLHTGWDFATDEKTPIYSVCNGIVEEVLFTQEENITYDKSKNAIGNNITIKCDNDYAETYYVTYSHLYPNSSKVKVGDRVDHWTEIANVGTTGRSTGNHLHYQVKNSQGKLVDGMQLINLTWSNPNYEDKYNPLPDINIDNYKDVIN